MPCTLSATQFPFREAPLIMHAESPTLEHTRSFRLATLARSIPRATRNTPSQGLLLAPQGQDLPLERQRQPVPASRLAPAAPAAAAAAAAPRNRPTRTSLARAAHPSEPSLAVSSEVSGQLRSSALVFCFSSATKRRRTFSKALLRRS